MDLEKIQCLSGFQLKILAIVLMTIDHIGIVLFPEIVIFRMIGRIAFPIFAFLLVEGALHTKDIKKYLKRLLLLAFISEIPFDLLVYGSVWEWKLQNVFFTLFIGVLCIHCLETMLDGVLKLACIMVLVFISEWLNLDYGAFGVLLILAIYFLRGNIMKQSVAIILLAAFAGGNLEGYAGLSVIPIALYNGERGYPMKYFFYAYYPIHLLVLWGIGEVLK